MEIRVEVEEWSQACCGRQVERNDVVTWLLVKNEEGPGRHSEYFEDAHLEPEEGVAVTGRATSIEAIVDNDRLVEIVCMPDGATLCTEDGYAAIRSIETEEPIVGDVTGFVVTIQIAADARLPAL